MQIKTFPFMVLTALMALPVTQAWADDEGQSDTQWETTFNAGLSLTDGNSDSIRANAGVLVEGERERWGSVRMGATGNYGKTRPDRDADGVRQSRETDVENANAFANAQKDVSKRAYVAFNSAAYYDGQALVDYRFIVGPGLGYRVYDRHGVRVKLEAGPSYLWEKVDNVRDDYPVVRLAERLDWRISETARVWQEVAFLPKADQWDEYLLLSEIGIDLTINKRLSWRTTLQSAYDATPAEDREKHDLSLIASLAYRL